MTVISQFVFFLSSFSPLFGVFALLDSLGNGSVSLACAIIAILGALVPFAMIPIIKSRISPTRLVVSSSQIRDGDTLAYVATYLVPFAALHATSGRERAALVVFLLIIATIYIRSELFYINPFLALLGYRLFQVTTPLGASVVLIARRRFLAGDTEVMARRIGAYVWWEVNP